MDSKTQIQEASVAAYATQLKADGKAQVTVAQRLRHVRAFVAWAQDDAAAEITPSVVARFFARPDLFRVRPATINTMKTSIRDFFAYLHQSGLLTEDPTRLLRRARCSPPPPRALGKDACARLLSAIESEGSVRDLAMFDLMLSTGIRVGSAVALDASDYDPHSGALRLRTTKGGHEAHVYVPKAQASRLRDYLGERSSGPLFPTSTGRRLSVRHVQRLFSRYAKAAKLSVTSTHALRHTFATNLYERTGDLLLVQRALLHRSLASTLVYARADDRRLRAAMGV